MVGASKLDPSTAAFNDIFFAAATGMTGSSADTFDDTPKKPSVWPILTFLSFIFVTPYLIMKLIGQVSTAAIEECRHFFVGSFPNCEYHTTQLLFYDRFYSKKSGDLDSTEHSESNAQLQSIQSAWIKLSGWPTHCRCSAWSAANTKTTKHRLGTCNDR